MQVRLANTNELSSLPAIERAAAAMFAMSAHPDMAYAPLASAHLESDDVVFVADESNVLAGFVIARPYQHAIHIQEIDVHPQFARRGVGAQLLRAVEDWSRDLRVSAVTLTTFDDVPWNGPYYTRLGYSLLALESISLALQSVRSAEEKAGLPMARRICMQKTLF